MNTYPGSAPAYSILYRALLQNELTTFSFSEAAFNLMEAIERKGERRELSGLQLSEAYHYACSILAFVTENQKLLEQKKHLAKSELQLYDNSKAMILE